MSRRSLRVLGDEHEEAHEAESQELEPSVVVEPNCEHSHVRQVRAHLAHYVPSVEPLGICSVEAAVIDVVVVSLGQNIHVTIGPTCENLYFS